MNKLHLCGRLGQDPEEKHTTSGQKLWELRVATRTYSAGQEDTIWWRVTVWGDQFDNILRHFKKGKLIYLICDMKKLRTYTDKNGQPQISYEATALSVDFLPVSDRQEGGEQQYGGGYNNQQQPQQGASPSPHGGGKPQPAAPPYQQGGSPYQQGGSPYQQGGSSYTAPPPSSYGSYGGNSYGNDFGGAAAQPQKSAALHSGAHESSFPSEEDQVPF